MSIELSIVIPTLQEAKLLPDFLARFDRTVLERHGAEVIVSDGGSEDDTVGIAERWGATVVRHEGAHRQTIAEGRNAGAAIARGRILVFLNADDAALARCVDQSQLLRLGYWGRELDAHATDG